MKDEEVLSNTESICPECLARIPARRVSLGDDVVLRKACPEHGPFQTLIWRGEPAYGSWWRPKAPSRPQSLLTEMRRGCPWDCGLCPEHRQQTFCTLIEVTERCDLGCKVCYADAGSGSGIDPSFNEIRGMYESLLAAGGPFNVQLSGGEPTLRDDLPEIISLGLSMGFTFIQLNTNGLRLAREPLYAESLKRAGLSCVFHQFDGLEDEIYLKLRGRPLSKVKERAVKHCVENELGVILVPTLVPGVNTHQLGAIIDFALHHVPGVRGVHFQPVSYFGRHPGPPEDKDRITIPEIVRGIEAQTKGRIKTEHFKPPGAENAFCSFHGNFVLMASGELKPWTFHNPAKSCCRPESDGKAVLKARQFQTQFWSCCKEDPSVQKSGPSLGGWEVFLDRARTHSFCISGMAFQDAWNLDLERLKACHLHVLHPDGRLIPFCAYNVTDTSGRSYYRKVSVCPVSPAEGPKQKSGGGKR